MDRCLQRGKASPMARIQRFGDAPPRPPWAALLINGRRLPPRLFERSGAALV